MASNKETGVTIPPITIITADHLEYISDKMYCNTFVSNLGNIFKHADDDLRQILETKKKNNLKIHLGKSNPTIA